MPFGTVPVYMNRTRRLASRGAQTDTGDLCIVSNVSIRIVLTVFWLCIGCKRPLEGVQEKLGALEMLNLPSAIGERNKQRTENHHESRG